MNTQRLSIEQKEQIIELFEDVMSAREYANIMRRLLHTTMYMYLEFDKDELTYGIKDGCHWFHDLCERLDPQLEKTQ